MQASFEQLFSGAGQPCLSAGSVLSPKQCDTCSLEEFASLNAGAPLAPVDPPTVTASAAPEPVAAGPVAATPLAEIEEETELLADEPVNEALPVVRDDARRQLKYPE